MPPSNLFYQTNSQFSNQSNDATKLKRREWFRAHICFVCILIVVWLRICSYIAVYISTNHRKSQCVRACASRMLNKNARLCALLVMRTTTTTTMRWWQLQTTLLMTNSQCSGSLQFIIWILLLVYISNIIVAIVEYWNTAVKQWQIWKCRMIMIFSVSVCVCACRELLLFRQVIWHNHTVLPLLLPLRFYQEILDRVCMRAN